MLAALPYRKGRLNRDIDKASADFSGHISVYELSVEEQAHWPEIKGSSESFQMRGSSSGIEIGPATP